MKRFFFFFLILFGSFWFQIVFAQNEGPIGPEPVKIAIQTEHPEYHYTYKDGHENIRIFVEIPEIIQNENIEIKSIYSRGPHTFTDTYSICGIDTSIDCFSKVKADVYVIESTRQYGNLFGRWALDAKYGVYQATTAFDLIPLKIFELDTVRETYTLQSLRETGFELIFLGTKISNQTVLNLEIFKISGDKQKPVFEHAVNVETTSQPPYFNRLPITFSKVPFSTGKYNITATWGDLFDSTTFEIVEPVIEKQVPQNKNGCLIATAAFGSELSPQVQALREFRDSKVLSTNSGTSFLNVFNPWYYSFSPTIANLESQNPFLQIIIKNSLYPLIGILKISELLTILGGEAGIISTGFIASTLIGTVYLGPISIRISFIRFFKPIVFVIIASVVLISSGLILENKTLLMVSTIVLVLSSIVFGLTLTSKVLEFLRSKNKKRVN